MCRPRCCLFLRRKYAYRLETNKPAPLRGTFSDQRRRYRLARSFHKKYSRPRRDPLGLLRGFSSFVNEIVRQPLQLLGLHQLTQREPCAKRGEFLFCTPWSLRNSAKILDHTSNVVIRFFKFRGA